MIQLIRTGLLIASLIVYTSCSTSSLVVGNTRPSIDPSEVKVYLRPPESYDEIALIESNNAGGSPFGEQAKINTVMSRMKKEAARLGANGILLRQIGNQSVGSIGTGFGTATFSGNTAMVYGTGVSTNLLLKTGSAVAIYVYSARPSKLVTPLAAPIPETAPSQQVVPAAWQKLTPGMSRSEVRATLGLPQAGSSDLPEQIWIYPGGGKAEFQRFFLVTWTSPIEASSHSEEGPNKSLQPTATAVTPPAAQEIAPAAAVAEH
jgi:hypothetical protein